MPHPRSTMGRSGRSNWPAGRGAAKVKQEPKSFRSVGTCTDAHARTLQLAPSGSEVEQDRSDCSIRENSV